MTDADLYHYRCRVIRIVDGDTFVADLDLGCRMWLHGVSVRVLGIDTPEVRGESREKGLAASARAAELLSGGDVLIRSDEYDNFGRVLAYVWLPDGRRLDEVLRAEGHVA